MNDRELDLLVREAFDALEVPERASQGTLAAIDQLARENAATPQAAAQVAPAAPRAHRKNRWTRWAASITAAAACLAITLALVGGMARMDAQPTAFIDIDINPSIELQVNRADTVVKAEGVNADGQDVLAGLDLTGLAYRDALAVLAQSEAMAPYLRDDAFIQVSVSSDTPSQEQALTDASEAYLSTLPCRSSCGTVSSQVREEARAHGMGCGRYTAALELAELDPSVSVEDCEGLSMRELRDRIAACHENGATSEGSAEESSQGQGRGQGQGHGQGNGSMRRHQGSHHG